MTADGAGCAPAREGSLEPYPTQFFLPCYQWLDSSFASKPTYPQLPLQEVRLQLAERQGASALLRPVGMLHVPSISSAGRAGAASIRAAAAATAAAAVGREPFCSRPLDLSASSGLALLLCDRQHVTVLDGTALLSSAAQLGCRGACQFPLPVGACA